MDFKMSKQRNYESLYSGESEKISGLLSGDTAEAIEFPHSLQLEGTRGFNS